MRREYIGIKVLFRKLVGGEWFPGKVSYKYEQSIQK